MKMSDVSCEVSFADYVSECVKNHDRLEQENAELKAHLEMLIKEATYLAQFKNETLKNSICSSDLDEPEWHDYQTIGEAAEYLGKLNK